MIGIVIVTYNNRNDIGLCLGSIYNSTYKKYAVFIIDNNSSDKTIDYIRHYYKKANIIKLNNNIGFAAGNNVGIKEAIDKGCDGVLLLNPDTIIDKFCLEQLVSKFDENTILQPKILIYKNNKKTKLINTTGGVLHYLGFSYCGNYRQNTEKIKDEQSLLLGSGAAMFIPKKIIQKIGYFDEMFFMYHEDVDYSYRALLNGFRIRLIYNALVWHKYCFSKNNNKMYYTERNRLLFLLKNLSYKYLIIIFPIFLINEFCILIYATAHGWLRLKIKSYLSVAQRLRAVIKHHNKNIRKIDKIENKLIKNYISELSFSEVSLPIIRPYNILLKMYWKLILLIY